MLRFDPLMQSLLRHLGARLKQFREEEELAAIDVAATVGCDRAHLWGLERGDKWPSVQLLAALAVVYRVEMADFFTFPDTHVRHEIREILRVTPTAALADLREVVAKWAAARGVVMPVSEKKTGRKAR
jgi:transcriptional regulator with XRE-family HTH domain